MALTYLHRTPSTTATNTKKATFSYWTKISGIEIDDQAVWFGNEASNSQSNHRMLIMKQNNAVQGSANLLGSFAVQFQDASGTSVTSAGCLLISTYPIRDENAWYHFVVAIDTTQSTESDRVKIWINGNRITDFHQTYAYYPDQNLDMYYFNNQTGTNGTSPRQYVNYGKSGANGNLGGGTMLISEVHAIDGSAYDVSTFGSFNSSTGEWQAKTSPSVSYGNNGFFLKFADASNLGLDSSGNGNNLTTQGTVKKTIDSPNNNFAVFDGTTLNKQSWGQEIKNSGTTLESSSTTNWEVTPINYTLTKGKWYYEAKVTGSGTPLLMAGVVDYVQYSHNAQGTSRYIGDSSTTANRAVGYYTISSGASARVWTGGNAYTETGIATFGVNDIVMIAIDLDNNKFYSGKNGTWNNSGDPTSGSTGTGAVDLEQNTATTNYHGQVFWSVAGAARCVSSGTATIHFNFGNGLFGGTAVSSATNDASGYGTFEYTVPSGYYSICSKNIDVYG